MANQEHLDILKQGVDAWNKWREEHPEVRPNLGGANLRDTDLREANLFGVDLSEANLSSANLYQVQLSGADLKGANLSRTDFSAADLIKANLSNANLSGATIDAACLTVANLKGANLSWASLINALLNGADLRDSNLTGAMLVEADLSRALLNNANLSTANLSRANLKGTHFNYANLSRANLKTSSLMEADLSGADLSYADLSQANLHRAYLVGSILIGANLKAANLKDTNLTEAVFVNADLSGANLRSANLVRTNLEKANLTGCSIHGISAWNVLLEGANQSNLIITDFGEPVITVDNLKVAQFIYLILNNKEIRDVIDTIAKKAVLILGRFTPERKSILEAIRAVLRDQGYLPILFDFQKPASQDLTGTVSTLANISRFIIADLTDPSCSPYEIGLIAPYMKPIKPLFQPSKAATYEFAMFQDLRKRYSWVLPIYRYKDHESLLALLQEKVIAPTEKKVQMLEKKRR
jgi:uncharacterized protein YjbI with pentapeptide repeats